MARKEKERGCPSAYDTALRFLTPKARTVREVENRLDEGCYSEGEIMQAVDRLKDAGLLDDRRYADDFIESRLNTKPVSRFRLAEQLRGHLVPEDVIDEALTAVPDTVEYENAVKLVEKFSRQFEGVKDEIEKRRRIYARLQTRGFDHETIERALEEAAE